MTSFRTKAISLCCVFALAVSLVPTAALAGEGESASASDELKVLLEPQVVTAKTTAAALYGISTFALDDQGNVALREGSYERWIDRVDVPQYALDFYQVLEEAVDNDGDRDYLIDSKYFGSYTDGLVFKYDGNTYLTAAAIPFNSEKAMLDSINEIQSTLYAVTAAFDRDHPEVFWLGNGVALGMLIETTTQNVTLKVGYLLSGTSEKKPFDVRSTLYRGAGDIEKGIEQREAAVNSVLGTLKATDDNETKVRSFNKYLTWNNEYNTNMADAEANYPLAWESLSALRGRAGEEGPVCEGYARALKVLCDRVQIPCVLVDGYALSGSEREAHMWNYVEVDKAWYAVDVTWNDPTGDKPGAESGDENENWLLVGGETSVNNRPFLETHPVANSVYVDQVAFTNGPALSARSYYKRLILPLPNVTATYGDALADIIFPAVTVNDAEGATVQGKWSWSTGSAVVRTVGTVTHEALFTPVGEGAASTFVSIEVSPKTITVKPGTIADKTYDGTTGATFSVSPTIDSGVLHGDDVQLVATATFADAAAGNSKPVNITYALEGKDARNYKLSKTSDTATATIEAALVVAPPAPTPSADPSTPVTSDSSANTPCDTPPGSSPNTTTPPPASPPPAAGTPTPPPAGANPPAGSSAPESSGDSASPSSAAASSAGASKPKLFKAPSLKKLAKPTVKSSKKKTLHVTWKKGATVKWAGKSYTPKKYEVQCSTDKKFKKGVKTVKVTVTKVLAKKGKLSTTLKKLKAKKTYYVRVRASYTIGGKTYWTPYGVSKKVKVK